MEKIIIITGVSSGIGYAFVRFCVDKLPQNWVVIGLGRNNIDFDTGALKYLFLKTDLLKELDLHKSVEAIIKKYGRIDVCINNAGVGYQGTVEDLYIADIRKQFECNFFGPIILIKDVIPVMRKQNSGQIINVSSVGSISPNPTLGYYDATKSAIDIVLTSLSQELRDTAIKINTVILGAVKSNFGKNMIKTTDESSPYRNLYLEWEKRFGYFFKRRNTAEEVAKALYALINNPKETVYLRFYDRVLCKAKRLLPSKIFSYINLNFFFRNES